MARGPYRHWDESDSTLQDFMDVQTLRVKHYLAGHQRKVNERHRDRVKPVLAEMIFESRQSQILHGGMGPKRRNLSQLDGDYDDR